MNEALPVGVRRLPTPAELRPTTGTAAPIVTAPATPATVAAPAANPAAPVVISAGALPRPTGPDAFPVVRAARLRHRHHGRPEHNHAVAHAGRSSRVDPGHLLDGSSAHELALEQLLAKGRELGRRLDG
jgi:hypothetical protein